MNALLEAHLNTEFMSATRHAELMVGKEKASQTPEPHLVPYQKDILRALHRLGARSQDTSKTRAAILKEMKLVREANVMGRYFSRLKRLHYTDSVRGSNGGVWLTPTGAAVARRLVSRTR